MTYPHPYFADPRVVEVREYLDGFVPNSYRWKATGKCRIHRRLDSGEVETKIGAYDRKRSYGRGPSEVAFSANRGVIRNPALIDANPAI